MKNVKLPIDNKTLRSLRVGDLVLLSGKMIVARDEAHLLLKKAYDEGKSLPCNFKGESLFYMGPATKKDGSITASGPTTSARMDSFIPFTATLGVKCYIGKGNRSKDAILEMIKSSAIYLAGIGGAGALYASRIKSSRILAYEELGAEALREIYVEDFPAVVAVDIEGNNIYD